MNTLSIKLQNCYGIKKLEENLDFSNRNVNVIYAKNGLMKTSLAKVFSKFQIGKEDEIKDLIFGNEPVIREIKIDGNPILKEEIFVINSFESLYESNSIASLLINDDMKVQLEEVLKLRETLFKELEKKSGLKISKVLSGKKIFELEPTIIRDFNLDEKSFLQNLNNIDLEASNDHFAPIKYSTIFETSVLKKIKSNEFQEKISDYLDKSDEIYEEFTFLEKGTFTLPKLKDILKKLDGNNFFVKDNKISLSDAGDFASVAALKEEIKEVEEKLFSTSEFKAIEKLLSDAKGIILKDAIENNPDIIGELTIANIENFRKKLWLSYLKTEEEKFIELLTKFSLLKEQIDNLDVDDTLWKQAVNIFNDRFYLPFKMDIENLTSSIIGENLPKVVFSFCDKENSDECTENDWVKFNRDELEKSGTLSQGEKRALFLLNIIFDIQKRIKEEQKTLFIIDDIADSFDYKNKYAIVEYLRDISSKDYFDMLILSHNFDFYRTISGRLNLERENKFHSIKINNEIKIEKEFYQNNPFETWKQVLKARTRCGITYDSISAKKHIVALIPFVRNLIEYTIDKQINEFPEIDKDYNFLTNLLHYKCKTKEITFEQLKKIYREYLGKDDFDTSINNDDKVYDTIINLAINHISQENVKLENKIILAIAIRFKAEEFMILKINDDNFVREIANNQTRELLGKYKNDFSVEINKIRILESVNIMTPENIHLNSFMYEPILDMDIVELKSLFEKVKGLF